MKQETKRDIAFWIFTSFIVFVIAYFLTKNFYDALKLTLVSLFIAILFQFLIKYTIYCLYTVFPNKKND